MSTTQRNEKRMRANVGIFGGISASMFVTAVFMNAVSGMSAGTLVALLIGAGFALGAVEQFRRLVKVGNAV
jgi:heme/copper-type cytochrome/quinol oxidase subunit 3